VTGQKHKQESSSGGNPCQAMGKRRNRKVISLLRQPFTGVQKDQTSPRMRSASGGHQTTILRRLDVGPVTIRTRRLLVHELRRCW
jgi:hypothetical protein